MKPFQKLSLLLLFILVSATACENFMEPSVDQAVLATDAVSNETDLVSVQNGIYEYMTNAGYMGRDFTMTGDVSSDNATANNATNRFVTQRDFNYTVNSGYALSVWDDAYEAIAVSNLVINSDLPSSPVVDYTRGQALALRALNHFNLLLAYGQQFVNGSNLGIPYITTYAEGDYLPERPSVDDTFADIVSDFEEAITLMEGANSPSGAAIGVGFMNPAAARGLLSRVLLYTGDLTGAVTQADAVINGRPLSSTLTDQAGYTSAWASGSGPNSLFELVYNNVDRLGINSISNILLDTDYGDVQPTPDMVNAYVAGDVRGNLITADADPEVAGLDFRVTEKYPVVQGDDNVRVIRLAEVYLNKAEALARSGSDEATARQIINDLNELRTGNANTYPSGGNIVDQVLAERRLELAFEGHRMWDLLRHGRAIPLSNITRAVPNFSSASELPFGEHRLALPIPLVEMTANSAMVQNQGYADE